MPIVRLAVALSLALILVMPACSSPPERLRVLSYNIHHGEGTDGRFDLARLAAVISAETPDLVALQEVDRGTRRASGVDQAAELGRLTGMTAVFGRAIPYQGGEYGDAVLSRRAVRRSGALPLPAEPGHETRVATWVEIPTERGPLVFVGTHLDHTEDEGDRVRQAETLVAAWPRGAGADVVLAGDLNAEPGSAPMGILLAHFEDASRATPEPTFPSDAPEKRIDWILVRAELGWRVAESRVLDERIASDHRPLLVVLERADD
ncbi:MAG: endonuclease/exonuclease/phosphatase family protein [Planctomycetota bacterium]